MSAPTVPTSSRVSSARPAARASMAAVLRTTPPSQRLIRRGSRRLPARDGIVEWAVEQLDGVGEAAVLHTNAWHAAMGSPGSPQYDLHYSLTLTDLTAGSSCRWHGP